MIRQFQKRMTFQRKVVEAPSIKRDPKKTAVKRLGSAVTTGGARSGSFEDNPVDLNEISRAYFTDSYIKRATDKHSALMFKNGWELTGKNDKAVEYLWTRLKLMAEGTGQSIDALLQEIGDNFVVFGNVYMVKSRAKTPMPAGVSAVGYTGKQPIAGYFVLPSQQIKVARDDVGKILNYQQTSGNTTTEFNATEIEHLVYRRPTGRAYGVPYFYNVLDDVKLLRQIEENVARLIYRNLFPLYAYKVGLPQTGYEADDDEILDLQAQIQEMPLDGAIVMPERHDIKVIGAQGQAIDASAYLKYFRQRVFAGLGVSDTIMGISDTANKSTSDNQSAALNDSVKEFQKIISDFLKFRVINELLFEGGFDPILNPDDEVDFVFHEIEFDAKIKRENHVVQLYMQNSITFEEMRQLLGREVQVDESRLFANMFAPQTAAAGTAGAAAQGNNQNQPANQHGKQKSPGKPKVTKASVSEHLLTEKQSPMTHFEKGTFNDFLRIPQFAEHAKDIWNQMRLDVQQRVKNGDSIERINLLSLQPTKELLYRTQNEFVEKALNLAADSYLEDGVIIPQGKLQPFVKKASKTLEGIFKDVESNLRAIYEHEQPHLKADMVLYAAQHRLPTIAKTVLYSAYNTGVALSANEKEVESVQIISKETSCNSCKSESINLSPNQWIEQIPPHHPNCECILTFEQKEAI